MAGTLFVVATPIGNLEDISPRAIGVLRSAALIAAEDTRHTAHLLHRFGIATPTTSLHEHNEHAKASALISRLLSGEDIALVSDAGTPTVSDPGQLLVRLAHEHGVRVEPVPGPSAIVAALSASGFPSSAFVFLGFPPTKQADRAAWFERLGSSAAVAPTVVFYEAPHRVGRTLEDLYARFGDLNLLVGRELTKAHEEVRRGPVSAFLPLVGARGEFTVVVEVGQLTESRRQPVPEAAELAAEFGGMTETGGMTRRRKIATLSRKYGVSARVIFGLLERAKESAG